MVRSKDPTKGSRMTAQEIEAIIDLIPERFQSGVLDGSLVVRPPVHWYSSDKPVIVGAHDNHIKHGRYATANNPAILGKTSAYKRKRAYREMKEIYIGSEPGEHRDQIISLKEIIDALWDAANGSPQEVDCPHPELHTGRDIAGLRHVIAFKKDPNALFKLYENLVGRANETTDINVNQSHLVRLLHDTTPLQNITVIDMSPAEVYERRKLLEAADIEYTDGELVKDSDNG